MPKVLVTGATGFIGHYVVQALLQQHIEVIASSANEQKARQAPWFSQVAYIPLDIAALDEQVDYYAWFGSPDAMIHLAWEGLPHYTSDFHMTVNLPRHISFLENMVRHGLKDLSVTGTCFEYGKREGRLSEDMPAAPANTYAKAKDSLRVALEKLKQDNPFALKWVRLFYMYGKGQHPNSLLSQLQKALDERAPVFNMSGGEQLRDYLPVETVADCIAAIALQKRVEGIINCCSGQPISVKQLVENYLQQHKASIHLNLGYYPYTDYEPMAFWGDTKKIKQIIQQ